MGKKTIKFKGHPISDTGDVRIEFPRAIKHHHSYGKTSEYFRALAHGKLLGTQCDICKTVFLPPRPDCPDCWQETRWVELPRQGRVATFAVVDYPGEGFIEDLQSVDSKLPCIIIYVELDGVATKLMSRLEECKPEEVHIGMGIEARFVEKANLNCLDLYWVPKM